MCMGLGCNAVGVTGCRIIDSSRERLIAMLTNCFMPCNGRFPTLIALSALLVIGIKGFGMAPLLSAAILTCTILIGIGVTFGVSYLLSKTLLRGAPSSFTLELPPYRKPQIGKVIVRSILNRTLFVLGRAVLIAAPAGLIIWLMANVTVGGVNILTHCAEFLDPLAQYIGLDGVILMAFILGLPANEIVVPIIIMAYTAQGSLQEMISIEGMHQLFLANNWTVTTIVCTMLFSLMHWPCSTTLLTIKKESGSKWMILGFMIPTVVGMCLCFLISRLLNIVC